MGDSTNASSTGDSLLEEVGRAAEEAKELQDAAATFISRTWVTGSPSASGPSPSIPISGAPSPSPRRIATLIPNSKRRGLLKMCGHDYLLATKTNNADVNILVWETRMQGWKCDRAHYFLLILFLTQVSGLATSPPP